MYSKLTTGRYTQNGGLKEIESKLHDLGHIEFVDVIDKHIEEKFRNTNDIRKFLKILFSFNRKYLGRRYSNRYQRYVNFGNAGRHTSTNRSIIDMFLIAKHYNPKFANFKLLYEGLMDWYCDEYPIQQQICSTIYRRVWFWQRQNDVDVIDYKGALNDRRKILHDYMNNELCKADELGTRIYIDVKSDPPYRIEYAKQETPVILTTTRSSSSSQPITALSF